MHLQRFSVSLFHAILQQISNVNQTSSTYLILLKCENCNELICNNDDYHLYEPWASIQIECNGYLCLFIYLYSFIFSPWLFYTRNLVIPYPTLIHWLLPFSRNKATSSMNANFFSIYMCHSASRINLGR